MIMKTLVNRLRRNERGSVGIWMGLATPLIVGAGAIAVDMSNLYVTQAQLQHTADAAALAAVKSLPDPVAATAAAQSYADKNMPAIVHGAVVSGTDIASGHWDAAARNFTPGATPVNAYRVTTRRAQANGNAAPTFFAKALGYDSADIAAVAVAARLEKPLAACIIALHPSAGEAFHLQGNATVRTYDCNIVVNSCHDSEALRAQGNVDATVVDQTKPAGTGKIDVCGAVRVEGPAALSPTPNASTGKQTADPFAAAAGPDPSLYDSAADCDHTNFSASGNVDLYPGVYCGGIRLTGNGTATFHATGGSLSDGLYIIKDGELEVSGTKSVTGARVSFFLTGSDAKLDFGGTADIGLSAPTTGPLAGFIFFGDRASPASDPHRMRGTTIGGYNGYVYLPGARLEMTGTATGTVGGSNCTVVVADRFRFNGTPNFEAMAGCTDYAPPPGRIALVN